MKIFQGLCEQRIKIVRTFAAEIKNKTTFHVYRF
jgi:hypothetical protein